MLDTEAHKNCRTVTEKLTAVWDSLGSVHDCFTLSFRPQRQQRYITRTMPQATARRHVLSAISKKPKKIATRNGDNTTVTKRDLCKQIRLMKQLG